MKQITGHKTLSFLVIASLGLFLQSCKKEPIQFSFEGVVYESVNNAGLEGVNVAISQKVYNGSVASAFFNPAGSATTDAGGAYSVAFDREKVVEFKIALTKTGYFDFEEIITSGDVVPDEPYVANYTLYPKSWVTFNLYNVGGSTSDEFTMIHYDFKEGCTGCTTNDYHYYYGLVDSTFTFTTNGGMYTNYSYKAPGASVYIQDSVYTPLFDTVVVDIDF